MRTEIAAAALVAALAAPASARAQGTKTEVQGFGGMTVGTSVLGSAAAPAFGGRVAIDLGPYLQAIGEGGRLSDVASPLFNLLGFTSLGVRVPAWYGEAGVRFIASPQSAVRPYGEATAGFARLTPHVSGLTGRTDALVNAGLNLINSNRPLLGVGGGVQLGRGPVTLDAGYRFMQISSGDTVASALNLGKPYRINQVRIGVGVRF